MAKSYACYSFCWNFSPIKDNELTGAALTEGSGTPTPTPVLLPAPTLALVAITATGPPSDNKLFKQFMKAYMEAQVPGQIEVDSKPCKQLFKAWFLDLYYGNLHINCCQFYQQCKDHFETAGAKKLNIISFVALFLRGLITQQWLQYKQRCDGAVPMNWIKFKDFL